MEASGAEPRSSKGRVAARTNEAAQALLAAIGERSAEGSFSEPGLACCTRYGGTSSHQLPAGFDATWVSSRAADTDAVSAGAGDEG